MALGVFSGTDKDDLAKTENKFNILADIKNIKHFKESDIVNGFLIVEDEEWGRRKIKVYCFKDDQDITYIAYHDTYKTLYVTDKIIKQGE